MQYKSALFCEKGIVFCYFTASMDKGEITLAFSHVAFSSAPSISGKNLSKLFECALLKT
jgi:hypothetical protein